MKGKLLIVNFFILPLHICLFWTNEHIIIVSLWMEKTQFHSWIWWQPYIFLSIVGVCVSLCLSPHRSFILFKIVAYSISNKITYISFSPNHSLAGRRNSLETMVQCTNCTTEVQEREYDLEPFVFIVLFTMCWYFLYSWLTGNWDKILTTFWFFSYHFAIFLSGLGSSCMRFES